MKDLAVEFFYDGISRIPPGLLIIILYWHTTAKNIFHAHRDFFSSPLTFIVCVLGIAWLIGIIVEHVTFFIYLLTKWSLGHLPKKNKLRKLCDEFLTTKTPPEHETQLRQFILSNAVTIMIRGLCGVFLFACF